MKREVATHKSYKNAFKCKKCPQSSKEDGCPAWWEQVWTEQDTKEQVIKSGCGFFLVQELMIDVVKQGFGARSEVNKMRKEVVDGVERATVAVMEFRKTQEEAISSSNLEGHNLDTHRLVRLDGGIDNRNSEDARMDTRGNG